MLYDDDDIETPDYDDDDESSSAPLSWRTPAQPLSARAVAAINEVVARQAEEAKRRQEEVAQKLAADRAELYARCRPLFRDPVWCAANDPETVRAVVEWLRLDRARGQFVMKSGPAFDALRTSGKLLDAEIETREAEIAAAQAIREATRRLRAAQGLPPLDVPEPIRLHVDDDAVARWLVAHHGEYTLQAGRWVTESVYDENDEVIGEHREFEPIAGFPNRWVVPGAVGGIPGACERWAVVRLLLSDATAHPDNRESFQDLAIAVWQKQELPDGIREEIAAQRGHWTFRPADTAPIIDAPTAKASEAEPKTKAKPGPRPLTDSKLDDRIQRRVRRFWAEHQRGPASVDELALNVHGARRERILERIKVLFTDGVLIAVDGSIRVDD